MNDFLPFILRRFTQPAYRVKGIGLGRICEFIRRSVARSAPETPLVISDFQGGGKFACYLREHMGSQIFFRGAYSQDALALLPSLLGPEGVFLDIGANHGEFTVAAGLASPRGRVIAVEPVTRNQHRLQNNIRLNEFRHVMVIPVALSDKTAELDIYDQSEPYADGTVNEGLTTLFAHSGRAHAVEKVSVCRLDDVYPQWGLERLDLVKLDIEGAELAALRGGEKMLARFRPILIVEIGRESCRAAGHEPEVLAQWLIDHGYRLVRMEDGGTQVEVSPAGLDDFQNVIAYPVQGS